MHLCGSSGFVLANPLKHKIVKSRNERRTETKREGGVAAIH